MVPNNYDDGTWTMNNLTATVQKHILFVEHGMVIPPKTSLENLKRAAQLLDHALAVEEDSAGVQTGQLPAPFDYAEYAVNAGLKPICRAIPITNYAALKKVPIVAALQKWDADHSPRIAAFLPHLKVDGGVDDAKTYVDRDAEAAGKSQKRKRAPVAKTVTAKRQKKVHVDASAEDAEVEDEPAADEDGSDDVALPFIKQAPRQKIALRKAVTTPKPATAHNGADKAHPQAKRTGLRCRTPEAAEPDTEMRRQPRMTDDISKVWNEDEDDAEDEVDHKGPKEDDCGDELLKDHDKENSEEEMENGEKGLLKSQENNAPGLTLSKPTGKKGQRKKTGTKRTAAKNLNLDGTPKTAQQLAEEKRAAEAAWEQELHNERELGHYSDPVLAERFRVKHKTVRVHMESTLRPGVTPAPTDQLGTWRYAERFYAEAKAEGRDLDLWMGGSASPPRSPREGYEERILEEW